jgi:hypothetical protein
MVRPLAVSYKLPNREEELLECPICSLTLETFIALEMLRLFSLL